MRMDDWWGEIDDAILGYLASNGPAESRQIAAQLNISEGAVTSLLSILASEGTLRIARVELRRE
jgi:DNA-binding Lrp family transcriptional regulator